MMSDLITLKHICREFDLEPYPLRQYLRKHMTTHKRNQRWKWEPKSEQLTEARLLAKQLKDKAS